MKLRDWWWVGCRVVGVYLLVLGALYAAAALAAFGTGPSRADLPWGFIAASALQAAVAGGAGLWQISRSWVAALGAGPNRARRADGVFVAALRLLGVFFLASGIAVLAHQAIGGRAVGMPLHMQGSETAAGVVNLAAGAALAIAPAMVAEKMGFGPRP